LLEGVTARQFAALVTIAGHEGIDQVAVTARTGIDQSTASGIIRRLTRKRLVQRRRSKADARAYALRLTDEGRRVLRTGSR
jgi:DNA-binding MarR family transcriptional regulator